MKKMCNCILTGLKSLLRFSLWSLHRSAFVNFGVVELGVLKLEARGLDKILSILGAGGLERILSRLEVGGLERILSKPSMILDKVHGGKPDWAFKGGKNLGTYIIKAYILDAYISSSASHIIAHILYMLPIIIYTEYAWIQYT